MKGRRAMAKYEVTQETKDRWALVSEKDRHMMQLEFAYRISRDARTARIFVQALFSAAMFVIAYWVAFIIFP